jgi:hypothetical protein
MDDRRNMVERFFTCVIGVTLAVIANALLVSAVTKTMLDLSELVGSKTRRRRSVNEYMETHDVPPLLMRSVKRYVNEYQDAGKEKETEAIVLSILPRHVRGELLFEVRSPVLAAHHLFDLLMHEASWSMRSLCIDVVKMVTATNYNVIFDLGDVCNRMLFLHRVSATYGLPASDEEEASHFVRQTTDVRAVLGIERTRKSLFDDDEIPQSQRVSPGSWVSEPALWVEWRNRGRLVPQCHGIMYEVDSDAFATSLQKHPEACEIAVLYSSALIAELKQYDRVSDVLYLSVNFHHLNRPSLTTKASGSYIHEKNSERPKRKLSIGY